MSLKFCVDRHVLGTSLHLVHDDGVIAWTNDLPSDAWILSSGFRQERCLLTLLRLNGHEINVEVPEKYVTSMKAVMKNEFSYDRVPWQKILPSQVFKTFLTGLVQNILKATSTVDTSYYTETFSSVTPLFSMLENAAINVPKLNSYLDDSNVVNPQTLRTFKPVAGSFARKIEYNRHGTRTGRLVHAAGPDILTLKRSYRDVITTCFPGGVIRYVDFSSLEARVLLAVSGHENLPRDIYTDICKKLLPVKSRNVMKLIVLATLFGSGQAGLQRLSGLSEKKMSDIQEKIREMFCVEELQKRLHDEFKKNGNTIKNAFGRFVLVHDERTLINSFVQSTGVDVALLGFHFIVTKMRDMSLKSRPIFILHDAMIIDTHPSEVSVIDEIIENGININKMSTPFYLSSSDLYTTS